MTDTPGPAGKLRFRTRNYKHEVKFSPQAPHYIGHYTDDVWRILCEQVARRGFTGLVLYPAVHPFEFILDYKGFPAAASQPARLRTAVRKALNRGLGIAHEFGLTTFMQHYVTHFTRPMAERLGISTTGRLANIEHPEIVRYQRYCYREVFRQCPDLDGLYFNFESAPNACDQMVRTAIVDFNRMRRKPIAVFRLWGANQPDAVRAMIEAYRGRSIVAHKISDTNDGYYLPVADSRATEWKRLLPGVEFMFLVGPCHNCGTNHCGQLWGDYDFVQQMLRDAEAKGADSISFHSLLELLSPYVNAPEIFSDEEVSLARANALHLEAVADYFHGRHRGRRGRAAVLAEGGQVSGQAGRCLLDAVEASSQIILLSYQQFCYGSSFEGYLNPGRYSHIQDPFYYCPATGLNDQATRLSWKPAPAEASWLRKRLDTRVTDEGMLQHIIDYVDPAKPAAARSPRRIAAMLTGSIARSRSALRRYYRAAGRRGDKRLAGAVEANAVLGEFVRHEILAAIELYGVYFARSKRAIVSRLRRGLAELEAMRRALRADKPALASIRRALLFDRFDPQREIDLVGRVLRAVEPADLPMSPCRHYLASRRQYNEIRRLLRPDRFHGPESIACATRQLKGAAAEADEALASLDRPRYRNLAGNVRHWKEFLARELARTRLPAASVGARPGAHQPMAWDHCFRAGEHFAEDFLGLFRKLPLQPASTLSFRVWRTARELVVAMREQDVDVRPRRRQWDRYRGSGSDSFVERIHVDVEGAGRAHQMLIVWPMGRGVSAGKRPHVKARTEFASDATGYEVTVHLPFALLGRRPKAGDVWGFNLTANPSIERNRAFTWAPQYDVPRGNPRLFGRLRFD